MGQIEPSYTTANKLRASAKYELIWLGAAFILGMVVNFVGLPSEDSGGSKAVAAVFLMLHSIVGLALVIGSGITVRQARQAHSALVPLTQLGAAIIGLTFIAGIVTTITGNDLVSFIMALGFIVAMFVYGNVLLLASRTN